MIGTLEYKKEDEVINYTSSSATTKDTPICTSNLGVLVPCASYSANALGSYRRCGVYRGVVAESIAVTVGANVFYDSAAGKVVLIRPSAGFGLGKAITAGTGNAAGSIYVDVMINEFTQNWSVTSLSDAAVTLTAAQVLAGAASQTPGANRAVTLPAAADLLALCPNAIVGVPVCEFTLINLQTSTYYNTLTGVTSFTVVGSGATAVAGSATFKIVFTNISTAAAVAYRI